MPVLSIGAGAALDRAWLMVFGLDVVSRVRLQMLIKNIIAIDLPIVGNIIGIP